MVSAVIVDRLFLVRDATPLLAAALTVVRGAFKGSLRDFEGAMQVLADGATSQHDAQPFIEHVVAYMVRPFPCSVEHAQSRSREHRLMSRR